MYAVVWIPQLPLQSILRTEAFPAQSCVALLRETAQRSMIYQVNSYAQKYGVRSGQTVSQAVAKCSHLQVRARKPLAEKAAWNTVFNCIYQFTPQIEATQADAYTLQLNGIPEAQLASRINAMSEQLKRLRFSPRIGVAESPDWALYASRCARPVLWVDHPEKVFGKIGIETAVDDENVLMILKQWGIRTLADFADLPQQAVGDRLGINGLNIGRSLHNKTDRILEIEALPSDYLATIELEHEIETLEPLCFLLNRLIDQLWLQLKAAFLKAKVLILCLHLEDQNQYRKVFKLPEPTLNRQKVESVLHTHLENLQTDASIVAVTLEVVPSDAANPQPQLFQHQVKDPWKFASTIHQLIGLVGSENVGTPRIKDSHQPDTFTMESISPSMESIESSSKPKVVESTPLKLQRFRPPQPVQVEVKNGAPAALWTRSSNDHHGMQGPVIACRGPWHLSGNWWDLQRWQRMEWDVQLAEGALLRLVYKQKKWFIEGAYG